MDTLYWGPSAWQLFHTIAFKSQNPETFLKGIKDILPCKYCRQSTTEFMEELPLRGDTGKWMYDLHNKVNNKLRVQCKNDIQVKNPGIDPSFEEVKQKYMTLKPTQILGRDFLFSVAVNYPDKPEDFQKQTQFNFIHNLAEVYPFKQAIFKKYLNTNPPTLETRKDYMKWMYGLLKSLGNVPTYNGYVQRTMYYKSGCENKTYKGKTCRRLAGGGRTKTRNQKRTQKVAFSVLL